ncbi:glycosyltransferase [Tellurirhabdus rosea]|uniref:glycosyltransferase n=1 Tax=Tellurirhabdus rosea TaxID=2674997 RepID=UPI00225138AB|nr:glycosyltransferase [Tellurirhabdus rosea]
MKLCIAYPNEGNYSETFIYNHLKYLDPALTLTGGWRPYKTKEGDSIIKTPLAEPLRVGIKRVLPRLYPAFYTRALTTYLNAQKPDVLLAEYGLTGCAVMDACQQAGVPLVVHFHGFDASFKPTLEEYAEPYKKLFAAAKALVSVSGDMTDSLVRLGADPAKVHRNPYGVETERFTGAEPARADKIVLAVGRFAGKKAPHLTIRAFDKALETHPDAQLVMIGSGELLESCQKLVDELQLRHAVRFAGVLSADEIAAWHRKARLFVQHSVVNPENGDSEGTPNTVLEAASAGLPVVSTRHAGIKEAVDHEETGFLVEEGDVDGMAAYIVKLLGDPALAQKLGQQGRAKMEREYEMQTRIAGLRNILEESARI